MNRDAEVAQAFLIWLLQNPTSDQPLSPSGDGPQADAGFNGSTGAHVSEASNQQVNPVHQPSAETRNAMLTNRNQSNLSSSTRSNAEDTVSFEFGEMSAVQDRFHALLKRRLQAEIERNPPLFPWENELLEYESEPLTATTGVFAPLADWMDQVQERLPVPMPEQLLVSLSHRCQSVVQGSVQKGTQLVQAVEALFPGEEEMLNYLARLVLAPSFRDGSDRLPTEGFPRHYDVATPVQQMALSLIAASEILDVLAISVSAQAPQVERQWTTTAGPIEVTVAYHPQSSRLRVEGMVPTSSQVTLQGPNGDASTQRDGAGPIGVELFDVAPAQAYRLTVQDLGNQQAPLIVSICVGES